MSYVIISFVVTNINQNNYKNKINEQKSYKQSLKAKKKAQIHDRLALLIKSL